LIGYSSHLGIQRTRIGLAKRWQIAAGAVLEKSGPAQAKEDQFISAPKGTRVFVDGRDNKTSVMRCSRDLGEDNRVILLSP
jgi:hypothetical protein